VTADPAQPAQDVGEVASEHTTVGVQLVDHHVAKILEERGPLGVVGQDAGVEHVGVGQHEVGAGPHGPPRILRRVSVVGEHPEVGKGPGDLRQLG
jgi:hypothetical protein